MAKNQVRLRAANGTIVRMSPEEAALAGSSYKPVGAESVDDSTDITKLTVSQLKAYASEHGIDLGAASKKKDILAVIAESESDDDSDSDDEGDSDDE